MNANDTRRKDDHVAICRDQDVEPAREVFDSFEILSTALPEINLDNLSLSSSFLGHSFSMPLMVAGMTGGADHAEHINGVLADVAQKEGLPFGLGSLKPLVRSPSFRAHFDVGCSRESLFVIGNFGAADLEGAVPLDEVRRWTAELRLGAVALHLNALQECIQPEGNRAFAGVLRRIEKCVRVAGVPILVKEVGAGIGAADYGRLADCGVAAVDVGGKGGTSWSLVEGLRGLPAERRLGQLFASWGRSTPDAVLECAEERHRRGGGPELVATGGVRNGIHMAVSLALGADMCGVALPLLRAVENASPGEAHAAAVREIDFLRQSLRVAMFCSGCASPGSLRGRVRRRS